MNKFISEGKRLLRGVSAQGLVSWTAGCTVGALLGVFPVGMFIVFGSVTLLLAGAVFLNWYRSTKIDALNPWELSLRDPDNDAAAAVSRSGEHYLVIAQAIEIIPHPQLNSRALLKGLGWDPTYVKLIDQQSKFEAGELLARAGGAKEFDPPNGTKFALEKTSYVTADSPNLSLFTKRTDYFTLRTVLPLLKSDKSVRAEFGSLLPSKNRVPHSLCLHYSVRFANGSVLFMRRDSRAAYHGGLWSISGEEQVHPDDFREAIPCLSLFQRSYCEEVISLRDEIPLSERWEIARPTIESMRLWSVFVEENIHNFSVMGVYQLSLDCSEFVQFHNNLVDRAVGTRDGEGDFFVVEASGLSRLLVEGRCTASSLFGPEEAEVRAENLHPTSRYRLFRLLRAVNRKPLEFGDYVAH